MKRTRIAVLTALPAVALLIVAFGAPLAGASGTSYVIDPALVNGGDCQAAALGGTWDSGTDTCIMSANVALNSGDSLEVKGGATLDIENAFTNYGTTTFDSGSTLFVGALETFNNPGELDLYGDGEIQGGATLSDAGTFHDYGYLTVDPGGNLFVEHDGEAVVEGSGSLDVYGSVTTQSLTVLESFGFTYVEPGSQVVNNGEFINTGGLAVGTSLGPGGNFTNNGYFGNTGSTYVDYDATLTNGVSGSLLNSGNLYNGYYYEGTIQNNGVIDNFADGVGYFYQFAGITNNPGQIDQHCGADIEVPGAGVLTTNPVTYLDPCPPDIASASSGTNTPLVQGTIADPFSLDSEGGAPVLVYLNASNSLTSTKYLDIGSSVTDSGGDWSITTTPLPAGVNAISGYDVDAQGYSSPTSSVFDVTVVDSTATTVTCFPSILEVGTPTTCTADVADVSNGAPPTVPTGTVSWTSSYSGTFVTSPCTLSKVSAGVGACSVMFTPGAGTVGLSNMITGTYGGDTYHLGGSLGSATVLGTAIPTSTSVGCSTPLTVNVPSACSATVTNSPTTDLITPAGSVGFIHSGSAGTFGGPNPCTLAGSGDSASCGPTYTPAVGTGGTTVTINVAYAGDGNHVGSSGSSVLYTVAYRTTSTAVSCVPPSSPVNVAVTCTATVTDTVSIGKITPTGTATFGSSSSGTFSSTTCTLLSGECSVTYVPSPGSEGTATISGTYGGDTSHSGSAGTFGLLVTKRSSSTSVSCSTPYDTGHPVTCEVTVKDTSPGTVLTPKGTISEKITGPKGYHSTHSCKLSGVSGTSFCSTTFTPPKNGVYTIVVTYPGDVDHLGSVGTTVITSH